MARREELHDGDDPKASAPSRLTHPGNRRPGNEEGEQSPLDATASGNSRMMHSTRYESARAVTHPYRKADRSSHGREARDNEASSHPDLDGAVMRRHTRSAGYSRDHDSNSVGGNASTRMPLRSSTRRQLVRRHQSSHASSTTSSSEMNGDDAQEDSAQQDGRQTLVSTAVDAASTTPTHPHEDDDGELAQDVEDTDTSRDAATDNGESSGAISQSRNFQQQQYRPQQQQYGRPPPPTSAAPAPYFPPPLPQAAPPAVRDAAPGTGGSRMQSEIVAFVEAFRASRSNPAAPPNALSLELVVRAICAHFRVNAFEDLMGTGALQLPALRQLHSVSQRVWTFVTCFMQSRRVNTLYECQQAFLQHEGLRDFSQLKLGNSFLHTEAVQTLYHAPTAVFPITTRDVLSHLRQFESMLGHDAFRASSHIDRGEFMQYLAQQYRQPHAEAMGVFVDSTGFGVYVGMLRRIANQEMKEMKALEQEFQRGIAEKVFQLTKEKFSTENRQQALEDLLKHTTSSRQQQESGDGDGDTWKKRRGGNKSSMQSLSLEMLRRVTEVDVYLDNVLRRKAAAIATGQDQHRKPISSQEIAETDLKIRNQLTRFLVSSQKSKHHSRLKVVTWVICGIMAKTYALLLNDDKLPDENGALDRGETAEGECKNEEECDCCCVGKDTCNCSCSCSCHVDSSDEEVEEVEEEKEGELSIDEPPKAINETEEFPVKPTLKASARTVVAASSEAKEVSLEEVKDEMDAWLGSQLSQEEEPRTVQDVLLVLASLEKHLALKFSGKGSEPRWTGGRSILQLLGNLLDGTEVEATESDDETNGAKWLALLTRSVGGGRHTSQAVGLSGDDLGAEVTAFVRECRLAISSSSLSSLSSEKQLQWVAQRVRVEFGCARVEDRGLSNLDEILKKADHLTEEESARPSILKYASALDVGRSGDEGHSVANDDAIASDRATGESAQAKELAQQALEQLRQCPCLVDVSLFLDWQERYAALCGPLRSFLRVHEMMLCDHASSATSFMFVCCLNGSILRVNEKSSASDLELLLTRAQQVGGCVAPSQVAIHLVSMLVACRGQANFPKQLVQAHLRAYFSTLAKKSSSSGHESVSNSIDRFVLEILLETPVDFAEFVSLLLLGVVSQTNGSSLSDGLSVADGVWKACSSDVERKTLVFMHQRGSSPLWVSQMQKWCKLRLTGSSAAEGGEVVTVASDNGRSPASSAVKDSSSNQEKERNAALIAFLDSSGLDEAHAESEEVSRPAAASSSESDGSIDADSCQSFIEQLRKTQFGVGLEIQDEATTSVLRMQQQRLERALKRLSDELYSENTHFMLELLQNADDNSYQSEVVPLGEFTLTADQQIVFYNNECGFSPANIQAICDVGASTKTAVDSETSIGKKGIGFKSVFKVSDTPQVHSNGFHICFHAKNTQHGGGMGYILPYWMEDAGQWKRRRGTTFVLPLNDASMQRAAEISQSLMAFEPSVLLFLRRIRELCLRDSTRNQTLHFLKTENDLAQHTNVQLVRLYSKMVKRQREAATMTQQNWLVVKDQLEAPPLFERKQPTEIALALPLADQSEGDSEPADRPPLQQVYAYLPLRSYGFRFILQGDFEVPSSREAITNGSEWNQWLVSKFPALVRSAVSSYLAGVSGVFADDHEGLKTDQIVAAIAHLLSLLPFENEVQAPFRSIIPEIMRELRQERWLACASASPASSLELMKPAELLDCVELTRGDASEATATLLEALSEEILVSTFHKRFLHPSLSRRMAPIVKSQLRIEQVHSSHLMRVLALSKDRNDMNWTAKVLALVAKLWRKDRHANLLRQELRLIQCFPLQPKVRTRSIQWVSLAEVQDSLFMATTPTESSAASTDRVAAGGYEFYGDLRLLHDEFMHAVIRISKLQAFLANDVGIRVLEDHDLIRHHVLPKMETLRSAPEPDEASQLDSQGLVEYGRFLSSHLTSCERCPLQEDVKTSLVVLTTANRFVGVRESNLLVILPSTAKALPQLVSWLTAVSAEAAGGHKKTLHIVSAEYLSSPGNETATAVLDERWRRLWVETCGLPLLLDVANTTPDERSLVGVEQVLQWIEEEDADLKRSVSEELAQYLDTHWTGEVDTEGKDQEKSKLSVWSRYRWLEGSDGAFHCPTDLWLMDEAVTRLFTPAMATFSSRRWKSAVFSRSILGLKTTPGSSDVLCVLSTLSVDSTLEPTLELDQVIRMYLFLWEESQRSSSGHEEVSRAFAHKKLLFIPSEAEETEEREAAYRFVGVKSVVWSSTAYNGDLVTLESLYPKQLRAFFTEVVGVQRKPSIAFLCERLVAQSTAIQFSDPNSSSTAKKRKKAWRKELFPILSALAKQLKKGALSTEELRVVKKTLKSSPWLPVHSITSGKSSDLVFCTTKERPIRAATESERHLLKLVMSLAKKLSSTGSKEEEEVKVVQLGSDSDLDALLGRAKLPTLASHLETHASTWCQLLARFSASDELRDQKSRKKLQQLGQQMVQTWATSSGTATADRKQFQWNAQHLQLFPTIDETSGGQTFAQAIDMYLNDQVDLAQSDFQQRADGDQQQQRRDGLAVLGLFPWSYFIDTDSEQADAAVARVRRFLLDFCGMKSLKQHLQYEVSVLSTQRSASAAFHMTLRSGLALAQRVLFHHHRRHYDQLPHDLMAKLATELQCVMVDGHDGFHVVYRVGSAFSLRRGVDGLSGPSEPGSTMSSCFLDVSNCTLYIQSVTGDEEARALFPVLMELSRKLFGAQVASSVANVLYLASLQEGSSSREQWLVDTQRLPPLLPTDVEKLWVEQLEDTSVSTSSDLETNRKRGLETLEDGEIAGEELPMKKPHLHPQQQSQLAVRSGLPPPFPPLPPASGDYNLPQTDASYRYPGQPPAYPALPLHPAGGVAPYPPLPPPSGGPGPQGITLTNTMTKEEREAIGRWGEEYVYQQLKQQYSSSDTKLTVEWVNEQEESGLPYDLTLSSAGKVVEYVEVKSTRTMEKGVFEISMNELDQAAMHGSLYCIYRVFNAGNPALCRVIRLKNPIALVRQRKIQLALVMQ
ncbi:hypothetical protein BBJ28_00013535 [Nothophytophthora sp. Chile5]|nr:hypothetical protein BBJ28_00013535 [Nothophytophthora sp. Chile5]